MDILRAGKKGINISNSKLYPSRVLLMSSGEKFKTGYFLYLERLLFGNLDMNVLSEIIGFYGEFRKGEIIHVKSTDNFTKKLVDVVSVLNEFFTIHDKTISGMSQMLHGIDPNKPLDIDPELIETVNSMSGE